MKSLEESVVTAMDGTNTALYPFLPYILQDLWEIGADPEIIINLICKHASDYLSLKVLDLGCGKGAVSVRIAQELNCMCHGIDAVAEFIDFASRKAIEFRVDHLCKFEVSDIRERIKTLPPYDIIILGSIGPVFGDYHSTLTSLKKCLDKEGIIIIDDGYIENNNRYTHPLILKQEVIHQQIKESGMQLIDEAIIQKEDIRKSDDFIFNRLKKRCLELSERNPDKKQLFDNYIKKQKEENNVLENKVICSAMVIKMKPG
ncbi:MAG: class I SAM-dependent methyltransferase [Bacteroidales bacterium]|nr:class I SAM-dependent methyltransferase [Bacteroidales bacterium]